MIGAPWYRPEYVLVVLVVLWAALFAVRITGPNDLMDKDRDQQKVAAYVLDITRNGEWLIQHEINGNPMSKPPLFNWLAAVSATLLGANRFALALPAALAVLGTTLLLYAAGRRYLDPMAGCWAALLYLLSNTSYRQLALLRADGLFTLLVFGAALAAFSAWQRGGIARWLLFWLAAALATLTKGPLGLLLPLGGLAAAGWEAWRAKRGHAAAPRGRNLWSLAHFAGLFLLLAINLGWFLAAWQSGGEAFYAWMIERELIGHVVGDTGQPPGFDEYTFRPVFYILTRFAPVSLLACAGLYFALRQPDRDDERRTFLRFHISLIGIGLIVFILASHKRMELYYPLLPSVALLAGTALTRWPWFARPSRGIVLATLAVALGLVGVYAAGEHLGRSQKLENRQAAELDAFAQRITRELGAEFPLVYQDAPFALQFALGTVRPLVSLDDAVALLDSDWPAFVVTPLSGIYRNRVDRELHELAAISLGDGEPPFLRVLSNHSRLEPTRRVHFLAHGWYVGLEEARLVRIDPDLLRIVPEATARIHLENRHPARREIVIAPAGAPESTRRVALGPGEAWQSAPGLFAEPTQ